MTYGEIINATRTALSARDSRRDILAAKIEKMADAAFDAARVREIDLGEAGSIRRATVEGDCSQWSNRMDYPGHEGLGTFVIVAGKPRAFSPVDVGWHDGRNYQAQSGLARWGGMDIRPATVAQLKAIARALPAALAAVLSAAKAKAEAETAEADEAAATL